jgi:hypothetical protein
MTGVPEGSTLVTRSAPAGAGVGVSEGVGVGVGITVGIGLGSTGTAATPVATLMSRNARPASQRRRVSWLMVSLLNQGV